MSIYEEDNYDFYPSYVPPINLDGKLLEVRKYKSSTGKYAKFYYTVYYDGYQIGGYNNDNLAEVMTDRDKYLKEYNDTGRIAEADDDYI